MAELLRPGRPSPAGSPVTHPFLTAAGLALGPTVALGFARFAYSLLLPAMRSDLHWTFAQAGAMNTANAVGYLAGAVAAGPLASRRGSRRPFLAGIGLTAVALLAASLSANFAVLLALRLVAGATGAVAFVAGAGLAARLVADLVSRRSAVLLGTYFAGGGLGIVVSAAVIPPVLSGGGTGSWRWGWVVLGAASIVALAATVAAALHAPEPSVATGQRVLGWPIRRLAPTLVSYALFGAGYIGYVTFVVPYLKSEGAHPGTISLFWALLGAAAVAAAFFWGPVLGQLRGGRGPAVTLAVVTVGALLALPFRSTLGHFTSAVVFGAAFLAVVTAVTDLARRSLPAFQVAPAIAVLTVAFGVGQSVGPVLAGVLSDGPSGVRAGLDVSVALLAAATMVALAQRGPPRPA